METVIAWVKIGEIIGFAVLCTWLFKLLGAQKTVVDTFKSDAEYLRSLHKTVTEIYDPKEIEKIIKVKEAIIRQELDAKLAAAERDKRKTSDLARRIADDVYIHMPISYFALMHLTESQMEYMLDLTDTLDNGKRIREFVQKETHEIKALRRDALQTCGQATEKRKGQSDGQG